MTRSTTSGCGRCGLLLGTPSTTTLRSTRPWRRSWRGWHQESQCGSHAGAPAVTEGGRDEPGRRHHPLRQGGRRALPRSRRHRLRRRRGRRPSRDSRHQERPVQGLDPDSLLTPARAPNSQLLNDALNTIRAMAIYDGPEVPVFVRVAEQEGDVYIDLGNENWDVVRITREGYEVVARPPVGFVRKAGFAPLPYPVAGGTVDELRPFLNIGSDG